MNAMRYLGIDYGTKKVGLALSDEAGSMGFPHAIILNTPRLAEEIAALVSKENVQGIVIGESRDFSGKANPVAKAAHELGEMLAELTGVSVFYESEVLTSVEARRAPAKEEKTRSPKSKTNIDASAAALILTSYLSKHHG